MPTLSANLRRTLASLAASGWQAICLRSTKLDALAARMSQVRLRFYG
jgi:hypothetical protein